MMMLIRYGHHAVVAHSKQYTVYSDIDSVGLLVLKADGMDAGTSMV